MISKEDLEKHIKENEQIIKALVNAIRWAKFEGNSEVSKECLNTKPLEKLGQ